LLTSRWEMIVSTLKGYLEGKGLLLLKCHHYSQTSFNVWEPHY
jgi:hypothetical protein